MILQQAQRDIPAALTWTETPVPRLPLFYATLDQA
jgi:hypothetical protein